MGKLYKACAGIVATSLAITTAGMPIATAQSSLSSSLAGEATSIVDADADPAAEPREPELTLLRDTGENYNIRIPAIALAPNGDLLASYDYRPRDGMTDGGDSPNENSVHQRRSTDNGATWEEETVVAQGVVSDEDPRGFSDPSYVVDRETGTIFNFFVASRKSGIFANNPAYPLRDDGTIDEDSPHAVNFGLAVSHDNGHTWEQRIITNEVLGPLVEKHKIISCFATSGAGTQKKTEPHAGRLLQQAACITDTNGNGIPENNNDDVIALTLYSDDHGETWQAGNPTDPQGIAGERIRFDENKVAELSDGSLMLNSRTQAWHGAGHRIVAISRDGGVTWGDYRIDESLVDPANNAQLIRAFPNAAPGTLRSKVLLFSNTDTTGQRVNGTLHISYDDGATWAKKKTFREEGTGYTTMAIQEDGSIGILLEPAVANQIGYMNTTLRWLDPDLQTELKAKENTEVSVADDGTIETLQLAELFERNDPLLEDTFEVKGLPEGLDFDASAGTITGAISGSGLGPVEVTLTEADDGTGHPRTATATVVFEGGPEGADETDAGLEGSAGGSSSSAGAGAGLVAALGLALGIGGLIHNPAVVQQARDFFAQFGIRI